ncbi:MAG: hypothetical protein QF628_04330 [Acidimicrobiales bacterium]|nr:hypothetical protein [Actinomycetota bacterium]MDP6176596.1 hypothetical protein [Acidimicrobiales bacterium]MDP6280891.1 hypothetical protein [Acidimicrobiales bacterium]MDP7117482.1 hypothetical protein [Acidimicrobiales bacterium]MDP7410535.1 hypothetical protein [Acidimicrobiales bacterium]
MGSTVEQPVTRQDLEDELRRTVGGAGEKVEARRRGIVTVVVVGGAVALLVAYLLGRRIGRVRSTVVEIRRI